MKYDYLFSSKNIGRITVKNRVVMPPIVCFGWAGADGIVTEKHIEHYKKRINGGVGMIVVEATCVVPNGKLSKDQLGIWQDSQIEGLKKISNACHAGGVLPLIQIHHAGWKTVSESSSIAYGPSIDPENERTKEMTIEEIHQVESAFVEAAIRAKKAGFSGVELHGAHGYLLSQFASPYSNKRMDHYGESLENRLRIHTNIGKGIREACGKEFILSARIGCNEPDLKGGIEAAKHLEANGFDLLHVSTSSHSEGKPMVPDSFPNNWIVYGGGSIHRALTIPVIVVNEIRTPEQADWLIKEDWADFTAIARGLLADANWTNHAKEETSIVKCLQCKLGCKWFKVADTCPKQVKRA